MLKQMMSGVSLLSVLISCEYKTAPKVELCVVGDHGCICNDRRLNTTYELNFFECRNYLAISPKDFQDLKEFAIDLAVDLKECQSRKKTGKTFFGDL